MGVLHSNDKDILMSLRLMQMMISSGASIEESMDSIGSEKIGKVSKIFSEILNRSISGGSLVDEIEQERDKLTESPLKKLLSLLHMSLSEGSSCGDNLRELLDAINEEEKLNRRGLLKKIAMVSDFITYVSIIALVVIIFSMMGDMMSYGSFSITLISESMTRSALMLSLGVYLIIIAYIKIIDGGNIS